MNPAGRIRDAFEATYASAKPEYQEFDAKRWPRNRYEAVLEVAPASERLLDVGCGDGQLLYTLRSRAKELFGLELARNRAEAARSQLAKVGATATIVEGNIEQGVDFADGHFDLVVCADTLQFVLDLWSAMTEMSRLLTPGGALIVTVPNVASLRRRLGLLWGRLPATSAGDQGFAVGPGGLWDEGTLHYFTFATLERLFKKSGILPVRRLGYGRLGRPRNWWPALSSDGACVVGVKRATRE